MHRAGQARLPWYRISIIRVALYARVGSECQCTRQLSSGADHSMLPEVGRSFQNTSQFPQADAKTMLQERTSRKETSESVPASGAEGANVLSSIRWYGTCQACPDSPGKLPAKVHCVDR